MVTPHDLTSAQALIRMLIDTRTFKKERLEDDFVREALSVVGRAAASADDPENRLSAIALLGKASEVSKPIAAAAKPYLQAALSVPAPDMRGWGAAEERFYLSKAIATVQAEWVPRYAARALAQAEINEKLSRDQWAELAINRATTLADALHEIGASLTGWLSGRDGRTEAAYRKLVRICEALSQTLLTADVPAGGNFGKAFVSLINVARTAQGAEAQRLREEAALSVLDLVVQILRVRFEVLFESDIYRAVGLVRGWWRPVRPPALVERRSDRIAQLAVDGLHILARQGVRDISLRRALTGALGAERINAVGARIAAGDPSLSPEVSRWLATGQETTAAKASETAQALNEGEADEALGRLLLAAANHEVNPDTIIMAADAIELFEPEHAALMRTVAGRLGLIRQWIDALAAKRRLHPYLARGEIVRYDPAVHDAATVLQRSNEVRVSTPGIVRSAVGSSQTVVIKAVVEEL